MDRGEATWFNPKWWSWFGMGIVELIENGDHFITKFSIQFRSGKLASHKVLLEYTLLKSSGRSSSGLGSSIINMLRTPKYTLQPWAALENCWSLVPLSGGCKDWMGENRLKLNPHKTATVVHILGFLYNPSLASGWVAVPLKEQECDWRPFLALQLHLYQQVEVIEEGVFAQLQAK